MVVPQTGTTPVAEFQNEGTPFRCLGLHTHRKDPAEAQARFSEDILQSSSAGRNNITAAQPSQAGQTQLAEPFKYSNSCRARQSFAEREANTPPTQTPDHASQQQLSSNTGVSDFIRQVCVKKEWILTPRQWLAESVNSFYTEGFPEGIILVS